MNRNSTVSPFLRLPAETRNKIYGLVISDHHLRVGYTPHQSKIEQKDHRRYRVHVGGGLYHYIKGRRRIDYRHQKPLTLHLGLLRVCRQIYSEAALIPYATNSFTFENQWVMRRCFKTLRPTQKRAMANFAVRETVPRSPQRFYFLQQQFT